MLPKDLIKRLAYWTLPAGFYELAQGYQPKALGYYASHKNLFKQNRQFKNLHKDKRCFIVANGPSINTQDLLPLKEEYVFSVSNGYHHKDFQTIKPAYHCVPQLTYTELFTEETAISWFREMDDKLGDTELFVNFTEKNLIENHRLFPHRKIHYLCFGRSFHNNEKELIDISQMIPSPASVPIMCIMIAMFMGLSHIYLLGVEHDSLITGEYNYYYKPTVLQGKDSGLTSEGKIKDTLYDQFIVHKNLWFQYIMLKKIAERVNISIYNATAGGALDVFDRVTYENLFNQ